MRVIVWILLGWVSFAEAQTISGSWYGNANVVLEGRHNSYLTELILKQKGDEVEGIFGYYFRNGYQSVFVRGQYDKKTRRVRINQIPITYFRSKNIDGVDCYMNFEGQLMIARVETHLNGYFTTDPRYKYTCPELRVLYDIDSTEQGQQDQMIQQAVARKVWQPREDDVIVSDAKPAIVPATVSPTVPVSTPITAPNPVAERNESVLTAMRMRKNTLAATVPVRSDSVRISFYDNGDVDGDTISVFLNGKPILVDQPISAKALQLYIALDPGRDINELTMFANNLGKIPPNTALMIVNDGFTRQEIYLSSSLTQNAGIQLRRVR